MWSGIGVTGPTGAVSELVEAESWLEEDCAMSGLGEAVLPGSGLEEGDLAIAELEEEADLVMLGLDEEDLGMS